MRKRVRDFCAQVLRSSSGFEGGGCFGPKRPESLINPLGDAGVATGFRGLGLRLQGLGLRVGFGCRDLGDVEGFRGGAGRLFAFFVFVFGWLRAYGLRAWSYDELPHAPRVSMRNGLRWRGLKA